MLKIIKFGVEYNIPRSAIATINAAYDGIRIILNDRTEIAFQMNVSPQIKALVPVLTSAKADIVQFNLDAAISGQYDKVLDLMVRQDPATVYINQKIDTTEIDQKQIKKTPAKKPAVKRGRPAKKNK